MSEEVLDPLGPAVETKKNNTWLVVAVFVAVVLCCCLIACVVFVMLALLGPSVGNVFSGIIEDLATPMP